MENFNYFNGTRYVFGKDTHLEVARFVKLYGGNRVLVHYGSSHAKKSGLVDEVVNILNKEGLTCFELGGVKPNPRDTLVYEGIKLVKENNIDFILAIGGGSVIDSSKAIALGSCIEEDFYNIYREQKPINKCLQVGVILTICAAGSESSTNSVISFESKGLKRGYSSELERPKFAILNPELTYSVPEYFLYAGITDIISHMLERYFSPSEDVFVSNNMIEGAIKAVIYDIVPRINKNKNDYSAISNLMWVGSLAHNNIFGVDRIQDWGSHKLEHELSAKYDVIHGAGLAVIFPNWMKYVSRFEPKMFIRFATNIMNVDPINKSDEAVILEGITKYQKFLKEELKMPLNFKEVGANKKDIDYLVEKLFDGVKSIGGLKKLSKGDAKEIYLLASE